MTIAETPAGWPLSMGIPEACRRLGVERKAIDSAITRGDLKAVKVPPGKTRWSILSVDLIAWRESWTAEPDEEDVAS